MPATWPWVPDFSAASFGGVVLMPAFVRAVAHVTCRASTLVREPYRPAGVSLDCPGLQHRARAGLVQHGGVGLAQASGGGYLAPWVGRAAHVASIEWNQQTTPGRRQAAALRMWRECPGRPWRQSVRPSRGRPSARAARAAASSHSASTWPLRKDAVLAALDASTSLSARVAVLWCKVSSTRSRRTSAALPSG